MLLLQQLEDILLCLISAIILKQTELPDLNSKLET